MKRVLAKQELNVDTGKTEVTVSGKDRREVTIMDIGNIKLKQAEKFKNLKATTAAEKAHRNRIEQEVKVE